VVFFCPAIPLRPSEIRRKIFLLSSFPAYSILPTGKTAKQNTIKPERGIVIMKKKHLMTRDEIKKFVLYMFVLDKIPEHVPDGLLDSWDERKEAAGCVTPFDYFKKCIDKMK
jgi:hypothetical protein